MPVHMSQIMYRNQNQGRYTTGYAPADEAIGNGLPGLAPGSLAEVVGPPGSGKSLIALQLMLSALKSGLQVLWVSCDFRAFPYARLKKLTGYRPEYDDSIRIIFLEHLEQTQFLQPAQRFVVVDHYDVPINLLPRTIRQKAEEYLLGNLKVWARTRCVFCTSAVVPRRESPGEQRKLSPALTNRAMLKDVVRLELYRIDSRARMLTRRTSSGRVTIPFYISDGGMTSHSPRYENTDRDWDAELDKVAVEASEGDFEALDSRLATLFPGNGEDTVKAGRPPLPPPSSPPQLDQASSTLESVDRSSSLSPVFVPVAVASASQQSEPTAASAPLHALVGPEPQPKRPRIEGVISTETVEVNIHAVPNSQLEYSDYALTLSAGHVHGAGAS